MSLVVVPILVGCQTKPKKDEIIQDEIVEVTHHNYFEVEDKALTWSNVFGVKLDHYFVYYYSPTCSHCAELKDWIIAKALEMNNIYFVKDSEQDVISSNVSQSIGASSIEKIAILGYPSLIEFKDGITVKNVAGKTQIQRVLNNY